VEVKEIYFVHSDSSERGKISNREMNVDIIQKIISGLKDHLHLQTKVYIIP
jgi:hypothetical protein